jgi:Chaperone of endosialidase
MKIIALLGLFLFSISLIQAQNNFGIGIPNPLEKLDVNGGIRLGNSGNSNYGTLRFTSANGLEFYSASAWQAVPSLLMINNIGSSTWSLNGNAATNPLTHFMGTSDAADLVWRTNNTEKIRLNVSGNLGIGISVPIEKLEVNGAIRLGSTLGTNIGSIQYNNGKFSGYSGGQWNDFVTVGTATAGIVLQGGNAFGTAMLVGTKDLNPLMIGTNNTLAMFIDPIGRVGVSTSNPAVELHIDKITGNTNVRLTGSNAQNQGIQMGVSNQGYFVGREYFAGTEKFSINYESPNYGIVANRILTYNPANQSIGFNNFTPNQAKVDLNGNMYVNGFLTVTNAIGIGYNAGGSSGMLRFNTAGYYEGYANDQWNPFVTSSGTNGNILQKGNAFATAMEIGTIDNNPLIFKVNNTIFMSVSNKGGLYLSDPSNSINIGLGAGENTTTASSRTNVNIGFMAGQAGINANGNVAVGAFSLLKNVNGQENVALGVNALYNNTFNNNVAIGKDALYSNAGAGNNTAIGFQAGYFNVSGTGLTFLGSAAGYSNTGSNNTFLGSDAGSANIAASNNTFIGYFAGNAHNSGSANVFIGNSAGGIASSATNQVAIGYTAGESNTGTGNISIGYGAGKLTTGNSNIIIGLNAGNNPSSGSSNVFIGEQAGEYATGSQNVFVGKDIADFSPGTTGGAQNVIMGFRAGYKNTANNNVYLGYQAGFQNVAGGGNVFLGNVAGQNNTGSNNVFIGNQVAAGNFAANSNTLVIDNSDNPNPLIFGDFVNNKLGFRIVPSANNSFEIAYGSAVKAGGGSWTAPSDRRIKTDIQDVENALTIIRKLRPVRYHYSQEWKKRFPDLDEKFYYGFIAQEYKTVFPDDVFESGKYLANDSTQILQMDSYSSQIVAIKAIQELAQQNQDLKTQIDALKTQNQILEGKAAKTEVLGEKIGLLEKQISEILLLLGTSKQEKIKK